MLPKNSKINYNKRENSRISYNYCENSKINYNYCEIRGFMKYTPIEMPRGTHYGNNYYEVYSPKLRRIVKLFSNIEYYNYLSLEINPDVISFCEQPYRASIEFDGKKKEVIFDMYVEYKDGSSEFQEVKYKSELDGQDSASLRSQEQIRREKIWCEENGYTYVVRTDKDILRGKYTASNMNVMAARLRRYNPLDDYYTKRVLVAFRDENHMTLDEMKEFHLLPENHELEHLCYLYSIGIVQFNIDNKPIDGKLTVALR